MWTISELKEKAKGKFKANYAVSVVAALLMTVFEGGGSSSAGRQSASSAQDLDGISTELIIAVVGIILVIALISIAVNIIFGNAIKVGASKVFVTNATSEEKTPFSALTFGFTDGHWKNVAITLFLRDLFVGLWTLLFIIPGIIKAYEYRMVPYILADNPDTTWKEAAALSKEMMNGEKMNSFILDLSFIGWYILSIFTCFILAILYVSPYHQQTIAELYITLKGKASNDSVVSE